MNQHPTEGFTHITPDGVVHEFHAQVTYHEHSCNTASVIFIDGYAGCNCDRRAHFVKDGIISIPYTNTGNESVNLKVRHAAGTVGI